MVYLDNCATTLPLKECKEVIEKYEFSAFYNASGKYNCALSVKKDIETARNDMAKCLNVDEKSVYFTPSATIANNILLQGLVSGDKKAEYIFSAGEHPSVYNIAKNLIKKGLIVHFAKLNKDGTVDIDDLLSYVNENTRFVSIIHLSNETGAINDIKTICQKVKEKNKNVLFHSDGVQAFCKIETDLTRLGVDCYTISAHKIHSIKGCGAFYIKKSNALRTLIFGGGQEGNIISGTENVTAIMCFSTVAKIMQNELKENYQYIKTLNETVRKYFLNNFKECTIISSEKSSPYILCVSFSKRKGEVMLRMLDDENICVSNGSACSSKSKGNRVLKELGLDSEMIDGAIRISFCKYNTKNEINYFCDAMKRIIEKYRG